MHPHPLMCRKGPLNLGGRIRMTLRMQEMGRHSGLMVSALHSRSNVPGLSTGQGTARGE